jgi:hypothetical protein
LAKYHPGAGEGSISNYYFEQAFANYSTHERLTRSKASNVIAELEAFRSPGSEIQAPSQTPLNASQSALIRGLRTISEQHRDLREEERDLLNVASQRDIHPHNAEAVRDVLRPGHAITSASILGGQAALKSQADNRDRTHFEYTAGGFSFDTPDAVLNRVTEQGVEQIERLRAAAGDCDSAILSIPFGFSDVGSGPAREDHVVLIAADFKNRKVLYLDSKATPIESLGKRYRNAGQDPRAALASFGTRLFGAEFNPETDVLELTHAKQQGANDCGPFTHLFAKSLIEGVTTAQLDGAVDDEIRGAIRSVLAADIVSENLGSDLPEGFVIDSWEPLDVAAADRVIALDEDEALGDSGPVASPTLSKPLKLDELTHLTESTGVSLETLENLQGKLERPSTDASPGGFSVTEDRVVLSQTSESAADFGAIPPGTTIPKGILLESTPEDLAVLDQKFNGGYLDRSHGVDTARAFFEINGERVPGELLRDKVEALARSNGITDPVGIERLYRSLDSQFPISVTNEFNHFMNPDGDVFNPSVESSNFSNVRDIRSLNSVPGEPGAFVLSAQVDRSSSQLRVGINESEVYALRHFEAPAGLNFQYRGRIEAKINFLAEPGGYPVTKHRVCRSLLTLEETVAPVQTSGSEPRDVIKESAVPVIAPATAHEESESVTPLRVSDALPNDPPVAATVPSPAIPAPSQPSKPASNLPKHPLSTRLFTGFLTRFDGTLPVNPEVERRGIKRDVYDCFLNSSLQMIAGLGIQVGSEYPMLQRLLSNGLTTYRESRQLHSEMVPLLEENIQACIVNGVCIRQNDANIALRNILSGVDSPEVAYRGYVPEAAQDPSGASGSTRVLFMQLPIDQPPSMDIADLVDHWSDGETIKARRPPASGSAESPLEDLPLQRRLTTPYPEHLLVEIPRASDSAAKLRTRIGNLISPISFKGTDGTAQGYESSRFIVHYGATLSSGHYVYFEKAADGTWTLFDDATVTSGIVLDPEAPGFSQEIHDRIASNVVTVAFTKLGNPVPAVVTEIPANAATGEPAMTMV